MTTDPPNQPLKYRATQPSSLLLRQVVESDLPELRKLDVSVFPEIAYPAFLLRQFYDMYADHFLVLDDGTGHLHGYVLAGTTPSGEDCWILSLCVSHDRRGHGLGRKLMEAILELLRQDGARRVRLTVSPANDTAIALYRNLGFQAEGSGDGLRPDYFGPGMDRVVMCLDLDPMADEY